MTAIGPPYTLDVITQVFVDGYAVQMTTWSDDRLYQAGHLMGLIAN